MGATAGPVRFNWSEPYGAADGQQCCEFGGLILWASETGEWNVCRRSGKMAIEIVSDRHQTRGININEAKQRAQGAAIVQLQLLQSQNT